ncbi:MAG: cation transporter [Clostridia bacterium]|nr:cation transporter [Clostridia bacterium]
MKVIVKMDGLDCAHCAGMIEEEIGKLPYASNVVFNFVLCKLTCEIGENDPEMFVQTCSKIVHRYHPEVRVRRI